MAQTALPAPRHVAARRRALFGLFDADGWPWALAKALVWSWDQLGRPMTQHHDARFSERVVLNADLLAELKSKGMRLIDEKPRRGAHHSLIAFLHPKATGGVLTEICQAMKH